MYPAFCLLGSSEKSCRTEHYNANLLQARKLTVRATSPRHQPKPSGSEIYICFICRHSQIPTKITLYGEEVNKLKGVSCLDREDYMNDADRKPVRMTEISQFKTTVLANSSSK